MAGFAGTTGGPLVYVGDGWPIKAKNINETAAANLGR
jgi:hypothetical protein